MANKKYGGLGKGLSAIFIENETKEPNDVTTLKISAIEPNRRQPRREFDPEALAELSKSIVEHGVLQPILVRPLLSGGYQIVAGERRYRAARMAGLKEIPVVIRELSNAETMQIALIENLQREDLSPLEEAAGYKTLMDEYGFSQEQVANTVGKSRSAIANTLRLLSLPDELKGYVREGKLSSGHARALLSVDDKAQAIAAADEVIRRELSVRETEKLAQKLSTPKKKRERSQLPAFYRQLEIELMEYLGTKVAVTVNRNGSGTLHIDYSDEQELMALTKKASQLFDGEKHT